MNRSQNGSQEPEDRSPLDVARDYLTALGHGPGDPRHAALTESDPIRELLAIAWAQRWPDGDAVAARANVDLQHRALRRWAEGDEMRMLLAAIYVSHSVAQRLFGPMRRRMKVATSDPRIGAGPDYEGERVVTIEAVVRWRWALAARPGVWRRIRQATRSGAGRPRAPFALVTTLRGARVTVAVSALRPRLYTAGHLARRALTASSLFAAPGDLRATLLIARQAWAQPDDAPPVTVAVLRAALHDAVGRRPTFLEGRLNLQFGGTLLAIDPLPDDVEDDGQARVVTFDLEPGSWMPALDLSPVPYAVVVELAETLAAAQDGGPAAHSEAADYVTVLAETLRAKRKS